MTHGLVLRTAMAVWLALAGGHSHARTKLPPPEFAQARLNYCKVHEVLAAMAFGRHRPGQEANTLPLVIQQDFRTLKGADLRMRVWTLNFGMNVARTEDEAKRGAFRHCFDSFELVLEQRAGSLPP